MKTIVEKSNAVAIRGYNVGPVEENESENRVASWSLAVVHIRIPRWFGGSRTRACESTCFVRSPCTQHTKKGQNRTTLYHQRRQMRGAQ